MSSPLILGILLASAAVTLATIVGWLMMAIAARWLLAGGGSSAPNRALLLAQARLLPLAAVAIVVPTQIHAFVSYEVGGTESAGFMLLGLGLSGILLCAGAAWRGFAACRDTARVAGVWKKTGIAMSIGRWPRPAWAVHVPFPVVAVVGALRPQLFVARQVVDTCTSDELAAIVAHEAAHVAARDNLVRLLFYITPGSGLCSRIGDPLERAWLAAAEEAADLAAGRLSGTLELASALTKVARLAAGDTPAMIPASTLIGGCDLPSRVERLLQAPASSRRHPALWLPAMIAIGVAAIAQLPPFAFRVHELFELLVRRG
jgi:Zn-dependent protease with chaperone function